MIKFQFHFSLLFKQYDHTQLIIARNSFHRFYPPIVKISLPILQWLKLTNVNNEYVAGKIRFKKMIAISNLHHYSSFISVTRKISRSVTILILLLSGCNSPKTIPCDYVIKDVNLISMENDEVKGNQDVGVKDGKIVAIGEDISASPEAIIVDGTDKFLMPGFYDMHAHFFYEQRDSINTCNEELKLMIANGVTTVRIASGDPAYLDAREKVKSGSWIGPEMIITSPQLMGAWPSSGAEAFGAVCTTPKAADSLVRKFKQDGYDQIKLTFMIKPDVYEQIQKTAKEIGIKVVGHVGPLVKLPKALEWGQQIEHMDEFLDMLLPDTTYNHGQSVSDMNLWKKAAWETVPHLDEKKLPSLISKVKESGVYVSPTNHFFYSFFGMGIDETSAGNSEAFQYVPPDLKDFAWKVLKT